ncbi:putative zinc finger protein 840 [Patella vulgata]|uniref:putative zinc finger protein 840 n=1 Tax=Patella vulgata TaxID=6465 RepID=UPI0024A8B948|nr:putative zinc finger protein 840 [Patella vulgata]
MDMETNDGNTFHQCVVCDEIFQQLDDLETHNKVHVKEEKIDDEDGYCHVQFEENKIDVDEYCHNKIHVIEEKTDNVDKYYHVKKEKTDDGDDFCVKEEKTDDIETVFQCKLCDEEFNSNTDLEKHCKIHVKEELNTDNDSDIDLQSAYSHALANRYKCDICFKLFSHRSNLQRHIKGHAVDQLLSPIGLGEHYDLGSVKKLPLARITNRLVQGIVAKFPNNGEHLSIIRALHDDCITFTDNDTRSRLTRLKTKARKLGKHIKTSNKSFKFYDDYLDSPFFPVTVHETSSADTNTTNSVNKETQTSVDETLTNLNKKNKYLLSKINRDKVTIFRLKNQLRKTTKPLIRAKAKNKKALAIKKIV